MACETCEALREELRGMGKILEAERGAAAFERERADELQGACNRYKDEAAANRLEADNWKKGLDEERARKALVPELLSVASTAAQIVVVLEKGNPVGVSAIDEAAEVATAALKQVRKRLEEGAKGC